MLMNLLFNHLPPESIGFGPFLLPQIFSNFLSFFFLFRFQSDIIGYILISLKGVDIIPLRLRNFIVVVLNFTVIYHCQVMGNDWLQFGVISFDKCILQMFFDFNISYSLRHELCQPNKKMNFCSHIICLSHDILIQKLLLKILYFILPISNLMVEKL